VRWIAHLLAIVVIVGLAIVVVVVASASLSSRRPLLPTRWADEAIIACDEAADWSHGLSRLEGNPIGVRGRIDAGASRQCVAHVRGDARHGVSW
jgi:hypothetical protein